MQLLNGSRVNLGSFKFHPAAALCRKSLKSLSITRLEEARLTANRSTRVAFLEEIGKRFCVTASGANNVVSSSFYVQRAIN